MYKMTKYEIDRCLETLGKVEDMIDRMMDNYALPCDLRKKAETLHEKTIRLYCDLAAKN